MEKTVTCIGFVVVLAVAVLKLVQLLQWTRCRALVVDSGGLGGFSGRRVAVEYKLRDGRVAKATLRLSGRNAPAPVGSRIWIIYDPAQPEQPEWGVVLVITGAIAIAMVAGLVAVLSA